MTGDTPTPTGDTVTRSGPESVGYHYTAQLPFLPGGRPRAVRGWGGPARALLAAGEHGVALSVVAPSARAARQLARQTVLEMLAQRRRTDSYGRAVPRWVIDQLAGQVGGLRV